MDNLIAPFFSLSKNFGSSDELVTKGMLLHMIDSSHKAIEEYIEKMIETVNLANQKGPIFPIDMATINGMFEFVSKFSIEINPVHYLTKNLNLIAIDSHSFKENQITEFDVRFNIFSSMVKCSNYIWIIGGYCDSFEISNKIILLNQKNFSVVKHNLTLNEPRANCASVYLNNKIYIIGGNNCDGASKTIEIIDPVNLEQKIIRKSVDFEASNACACVINEWIYVASNIESITKITFMENNEFKIEKIKINTNRGDNIDIVINYNGRLLVMAKDFIKDHEKSITKKIKEPRSFPRWSQSEVTCFENKIFFYDYSNSEVFLSDF